MRTVFRFTAAIFVCACLNAVVAAQESSVKPGINDSYDKTTVENKVKQFERANRDVVQKQNDILDICLLKPGMDVADVGAGTGLFTRLFAAKVKPQGKVYAVDITRKFIEHIERTCKEQNIKNVEGVVCPPNSINLKPNSVDLVFTCNTYHHFEYPQKTLASVHAALRKGGRLIVIDFSKKEGVGPKWVMGHVRAGKKTVTEEITKAGFKLIDEVPLMKAQYVLRFEKK
jgi:ubiquinone/menaquinone biosynthesis C-methylase UbiE